MFVCDLLGIGEDLDSRGQSFIWRILRRGPSNRGHGE
ncbi:unnamed protein product [Musa acuminata subsp. malaccensis]|uniref:(wild Malaysian banana) hypothetical protein n=1 Tax=Musa acuminata subsp. malaccensis TaxID=214687 RepID=A0A804KXL8_MUSAM|nr:unnamed protein product [Musa acuminata subsp. malaccensis]